MRSTRSTTSPAQLLPDITKYVNCLQYYGILVEHLAVQPNQNYPNGHLGNDEPFGACSGIQVGSVAFFAFNSSDLITRARILQASTSEVYGNPTVHPQVRQPTPGDLISPFDYSSLRVILEMLTQLVSVLAMTKANELEKPSCLTTIACTR